MSMPVPIEFTSHHVDQTMQIGYHIGAALQAGDVICLSGHLGAGKTALTRGIGVGWGALEPVTSPTFTLIHEHRRAVDNQVLYHVDCYRLDGPEAAWGIGLDDVLHSGESPVVLEWPEHIQPVLPSAHLWITLVFIDDAQRQLTFSATGTRYQELVDQLRASLPGN